MDLHEIYKAQGQLHITFYCYFPLTLQSKIITNSPKLAEQSFACILAITVAKSLKLITKDVRVP